MPRRCCTWLKAIINAEAVTKPVTTGCDMKFATKPSFRNPNKISKVPDINASVIAAKTYCSGAKPSVPSAAAVIRDMIATGPTDSTLLEPNKA